MFEDLRDIWAWACYWSNHKSWIWLFGTWVQILALLNQYRAGFNCFSQKVGFWHFLNESAKQHWDLSRLFPGRWSRHRYQLSAINQRFNERDCQMSHILISYKKLSLFLDIYSDDLRNLIFSQIFLRHHTGQHRQTVTQDMWGESWIPYLHWCRWANQKWHKLTNHRPVVRSHDIYWLIRALQRPVLMICVAGEGLTSEASLTAVLTQAATWKIKVSQ